MGSFDSTRVGKKTSIGLIHSDKLTWLENGPGLKMYFLLNSWNVGYVARLVYHRVYILLVDIQAIPQSY